MTLITEKLMFLLIFGLTILTDSFLLHDCPREYCSLVHEFKLNIKLECSRNHVDFIYSLNGSNTFVDEESCSEIRDLLRIVD
jgi:hypothetical protein